MGDKLERIGSLFQPQLAFVRRLEVLEAQARVIGNQPNALKIFIDPLHTFLERQSRNTPSLVEAVCGRNLEPPDAPLPDPRTVLEAEQRSNVVGSGVIEIWDRLNTPAPFAGERQIERLAAKDFSLL